MVQGVKVDNDGCIVNTNPATGGIISHVKCTTNDEVNAMIETAKKVQSTWSYDTTLEKRIDLLKKGLQLVKSKTEQFEKLIVNEMGKPLKEAKEEMECAYGKDEFLQILYDSLKPQTFNSSVVVRHPIGLVVILSPWNFPVDEILLLALPSLASGNTVIVKPSEVVPETGALLIKTLQEVLPENVIQLAQGDGKVGAQLVSHTDVNMIAMTGSSATGSKILANAASNMKKVVLEMGGKDPMIVMSDADLDKAAKDGVEYSLCNTGQVCCSIERIYVAESAYTKFQTLVRQYALEYVVGYGMDDNVRVGPLVSMLQRDHVAKQVEDAISKGAKVLHQSEIPKKSSSSSEKEKGGDDDGSKIGEPSFYPVTVLADVTDDMLVFSDETFGPIVAMTKFDGTETEAIKLANNTEYGLASCVYTQDMNKANRIAQRIDAGQVGINCYSLDGMDVNCPWVGHKQSGYGYHSGVDGFHQFSIPKTLVYSQKPPEESV